jgi:hypothetical protein
MADRPKLNITSKQKFDLKNAIADFQSNSGGGTINFLDNNALTPSPDEFILDAIIVENYVPVQYISTEDGFYLKIS